MKKFILLFICIQINTFQAQIKNGNVIYSKILNVDFNSPRLSENKELSDKIKESQKNSEKIEYALNFNLGIIFLISI